MSIGRLHSVAWLVWSLAAVVCIQLAGNPLYVGIVVLLAVIVADFHRVDSAMARTFGFFVAAAAVFGGLRVMLTALTTHGSGDTIVTLPAFTLPRILGGFSVGGAISTDVVAAASAEAFVVFATIVVFGAFNAVISHRELLRSTPRAFHEPGLVVTVALAFVPSTLASISATRESDRARTGGVVVRRGRILRSLVPVLESGLERAIALAESMDSRGFARGAPTRGEVVATWAGAGGLMCLAASFVALVGRASGLGLVLALSGAALLGFAVLAASAGAERVRYRHRGLGGLDWLVMACATGSAVLVGVLAAAGNDTLSWVYAVDGMPQLDPIVVVALAGLAVPAGLRPVVPAPEAAPRSLETA